MPSFELMTLIRRMNTIALKHILILATNQRILCPFFASLKIPKQFKKVNNMRFFQPNSLPYFRNQTRQHFINNILLDVHAHIQVWWWWYDQIYLRLWFQTLIFLYHLYIIIHKFSLIPRSKSFVSLYVQPCIIEPEF